MPNPTSSLLRLADEVDQIRRLIPQVSPPQRSVIRAFHGSPYDWDRVDMSMVTKGEGPLVEGFGFYATDDPNTANWYRHRNAAIRRQLIANDIRAARRDGDLESLGNARQLAQKLQRVQPHGRTYELEIGYSPDSLLKYNAPLSQQSESVRRALSEAFPGELADSGDLTGGQFYQWVLSGGNVLDRAPVSAQRKASEMLFSAGVPGHSYHHGGTNYVLYPGTEDAIRILRKFAVPGLVGTGAAAMSGEE